MGRNQDAHGRFRVLVLCYSQTGRTAEVLEGLVRPLRGRADVELCEARIEPVTPFPYPWPLSRIWSAFPEVVGEVPIPLRPAEFDATRKYDLILLGCQVWFLSCSLPVSSFFHGPQSRVFADTPVVPVLTFRKAWATGLACVTEHVRRLGGRVAGRVVMRARDRIPLPVLRAPGRGRLPPGEKEWSYDRDEWARLEEMGAELAASLPRLRAEPGAPAFRERSSVLRPFAERAPGMSRLDRLIEKHEGAQKRRYLRWGARIRRRSKPLSRLRFTYLLVCWPAFLPPIYWTAPLLLLRRCWRRQTAVM